MKCTWDVLHGQEILMVSSIMNLKISQKKISRPKLEERSWESMMMLNLFPFAQSLKILTQLPNQWLLSDNPMVSIYFIHYNSLIFRPILSWKRHYRSSDSKRLWWKSNPWWRCKQQDVCGCQKHKICLKQPCKYLSTKRLTQFVI